MGAQNKNNNYVESNKVSLYLMEHPNQFNSKVIVGIIFALVFSSQYKHSKPIDENKYTLLCSNWCLIMRSTNISFINATS